MKNIYKNMTNVDIDNAREIWDERSKGYLGEYLVFCNLYQNLHGQYKILMNINFPFNDDRTTEIDLMLIHETGLYIFEIKYYKGIICGSVNDEKWTQFFKTVPNKSFPNPVKQNDYHIKAVKQKYPNIPIYSFIVFSNHECKLNINDYQQGTIICELDNLKPIMAAVLGKKKKCLSTEDIERYFNEIKIYSNLNDKVVDTENEQIPFYKYIDFLKQKDKNLDREFKTRIQINEEYYKKKTKKILIRNISISSVLIVLFFVFIGKTAIDANKKVAVAQKELSDFKKNSNMYKK